LPPGWGTASDEHQKVRRVVEHACYCQPRFFSAGECADLLVHVFAGELECSRQVSQRPKTVNGGNPVATAKAKPVDTTEPWFNGVAKRAKAGASSKTIPEVQSLLGAYHEFEQSKLQTALLIPEYNPLSHKNQNDIIDSEQLIYLSDPSLCMLTADKGIKSKVVKSEQAARIVVATPEDLSDAKKAEAVVGCALGI
jgi:hypothetical protein